MHDRSLIERKINSIAMFGKLSATQCDYKQDDNV